MLIRKEANQYALPTAVNEDSLIVSARAGDHAAFAELHRRHAPMTARVVQRITRNLDDTDDVVQEAFSRAYVHLNDFDGRSKFSAWVVRIAINCALMLYRKRKRLREESLDLTHDSAHFGLMQLPDHRANPETYCILSNARAELASAVGKLPLGFKEVMTARLKDSSQVQEIAKTVGLSVPATKSRIARATRILKMI